MNGLNKALRNSASVACILFSVVSNGHGQARADKVKIGTGTANVVTLQSAGVSAPRTISIPDPGTSGVNIILSTLSGTSQTITGPLAISGATPIFSVPSGSSTTVLALNSSNQVITATGTASISGSGSGTANAIALWSGSAALGNSILTDDGTQLNYNSKKLLDTAATGGLFVAGNLHLGGAMQVQSVDATGTSAYSATYNDFEISYSTSGNPQFTVTPYDAVAGRVYLISCTGNKGFKIGTFSIASATTALVISDGTNWHRIQ